jgi:hypothetical protein
MGLFEVTEKAKAFVVFNLYIKPPLRPLNFPLSPLW